MPYASQNQITLAAGGATAFDQLFDWDGDGTPDANVIAEAQLRADGWIDGFLRKRFKTPVAAPSDTLIRISADECVYWARTARPGVGIDQRDVDKHKEREQYLQDLADGKKGLDEPNPPKSSEVRGVQVALGGHITRDGLKGMW